MSDAEINLLLNDASKIFGAQPDEIISSCREAHLVKARIAISQIMREKDMTLLTIGIKLGNRDHATILHYVNYRHPRLMKTNKHYRLKFNKLGERFKMEDLIERKIYYEEQAKLINDFINNTSHSY